MADMQTIPSDMTNGSVDAVSISINIGTTIRGYRLQKGMSQGDIEKRTGLLRCYLSRVENGHTVPSLETLQKIARALDLQLSEFFAEEAIGKEMSGLNLNEEEIRFLTQVQRYSAHLSDSDRRLLLANCIHWAYVQNIPIIRVTAIPHSKCENPADGRVFFLIYIFSIPVWMELKRQVYFLLFDGVRLFWGLTRDFWAENAKNKLRGS